MKLNKKSGGTNVSKDNKNNKQPALPQASEQPAAVNEAPQTTAPAQSIPETPAPAAQTVETTATPQPPATPATTTSEQPAAAASASDNKDVASDPAKATDNKMAKAQEARKAKADARAKEEAEFAALPFVGRCHFILKRWAGEFMGDVTFWNEQADIARADYNDNALADNLEQIAWAFAGMIGMDGSTPSSLRDMGAMLDEYLPADWKPLERKKAAVELAAGPTQRFNVGDIVDLKPEYVQANQIEAEEAVGLEVILIRGKEMQVGLRNPNTKRFDVRLGLKVTDVTLVKKAEQPPAATPAT